jgi:hypothetical protein
MSDKVVEFDVPEVQADTDKAILAEIDGTDVWIPKSQIKDESEVWKKGQSGKLVVTEWIATQKGLV